MDKLKKKNLWVMCGIPGSGKSTLIKKFQDWTPNEKIAVVSRDAIRYSILNENDDYFAKEDEVFNTFINTIKSFISSDTKYIMVDATHISKGSRKKLLNALGSSLKDVYLGAMVLDTSLETCLARNAEREGRACVPEKVIINMSKSFTIPTLEEGFDVIHIYSENGTNKTIIKDGDN
jgi:predicted kinase